MIKISQYPQIYYGLRFPSFLVYAFSTFGYIFSDPSRYTHTKRKRIISPTQTNLHNHKHIMYFSRLSPKKKSTHKKEKRLNFMKMVLSSLYCVCTLLSMSRTLSPFISVYLHIYFVHTVVTRTLNLKRKREKGNGYKC